MWRVKQLSIPDAPNSAGLGQTARLLPWQSTTVGEAPFALAESGNLVRKLPIGILGLTIFGLLHLSIYLLKPNDPPSKGT